MSRATRQQVTIVVDGVEIEAEEGTMLVDAAKQGDIEIPVFCYDAKLGDPVAAEDVPHPAVLHRSTYPRAFPLGQSCLQTTEPCESFRRSLIHAATVKVVALKSSWFAVST